MGRKCFFGSITVYLIVGLLLAVMTCSLGWNTNINTADLNEIILNNSYFDEFEQDEIISVLIYLDDQVDIPMIDSQLDEQKASLKDRHETVVIALQNTAITTQGEVIEYLTDLKKQGAVETFESYWISNVVRVDASKDTIKSISDHPDVRQVYPNYKIELIKPERIDQSYSPSDRMIELGIEAIRAQEVWAMGYNGSGSLVANIDTGVDGNHPALASRWAGLLPEYEGHPEWAWFDPYSNQNDFPFDGGYFFARGHGTHTMGTVCGGAPGDQIGVAPGAHWIAAAAISRGGDIMETVADAIESFQWLIDPDGDPYTDFDVPDVCSNSWGLLDAHGYPPCDETFWSFIDACEAAGIVILFSAGNEGMDGLRRPADRATDDYRNLAVAAVDANEPGWPIASFSSRGPTFCTPNGIEAIKPDIAAPGVHIRSAIPGGEYGNKSGTSMASPHVNGVVALMREACPYMGVEEIKQILYDTAYDLGIPGEDNDYGWGMIDAYEAVQMTLNCCGPVPPIAYDDYYEIHVNESIIIELRAIDYDEFPFPLQYLITSLPVSGHTLTNVTNGHVITEEELPYSLGENNQILYTPNGIFYGYDEFSFKATDGGVPPDGGESNEANITLFLKFNPPEIITTELPIGYLNKSYGPFSIQVDEGQPPLEWILYFNDYEEIDLGRNEFSYVGEPQGWHANDQTWSYSLPFAFRFYNQQYTSVWVSSNGFLDFTSHYDDSTNTDEELINSIRIAPLWDDLRTNAGGDIFIDTSHPEEVTFRWNAIVVDEDYEDVKFSCTLSENGSIRFNYGSIYPIITPTIGISGGDGIHYLLSQYNNESDLDHANSLDITPLPVLPANMNLSTDGILSGTPVELGIYEFWVGVNDSLNRSDIELLSLMIQEPIPGDANGDGVVNIEDLLIVLAQWGTPGPEGDVNHDGIVDIQDLLIVLSNWSM